LSCEGFRFIVPQRPGRDHADLLACGELRDIRAIVALGAEIVARTINLKFRASKAGNVLGPSGMRLIDSLMWESSV